MDPPIRQPACILAADIAGFSAMMERDEADAYGRVKEIVGTLVAEHLKSHGGCLVKTTGDGFLALFASPTDAVRCSVGIQKAVAADQTDHVDPIRYRMGLDLGESFATPMGTFMARSSTSRPVWKRSHLPGASLFQVRSTTRSRTKSLTGSRNRVLRH